MSNKVYAKNEEEKYTKKHIDFQYKDVEYERKGDNIRKKVMKKEEVILKLQELISWSKSALEKLKSKEYKITFQRYDKFYENEVDEIIKKMNYIFINIMKFYSEYSVYNNISMSEDEYELLLQEVTELADKYYFITSLNIENIEKKLYLLKNELINYSDKIASEEIEEEILPNDLNKNESSPLSSTEHCYLTTACMKRYLNNFNDHCYELTLLRWFRDNFVSKEDIKHYYKIAPIIVGEIDKDNNNDIVYDYIYDNIVDYCVEQIENGNYAEAYKRYKDSVMILEKKYVKGISKIKRR